MPVTGKGSKERDVPIHALLTRAMEHLDPDEYFFPSQMSMTGHVPPASLGRSVRDLLGHSSVSTTEMYTQTRAGRLVEHVNNLPDFADAGLFEKEMLALP